MLKAWSSSWHHQQIWKAFCLSSILIVICPQQHLLMAFHLNPFLSETWVTGQVLGFAFKFELAEEWSACLASHQIDCSLVSLGIEVSVRTSTIKDHSEALYTSRRSTKNKFSRSWWIVFAENRTSSISCLKVTRYYMHCTKYATTSTTIDKSLLWHLFQ